MSSIPCSKLKWVRVESGIRKRANDDGSTVYEVRVRRKGTSERTLTCPTLREAHKQRDIARSHAREGKPIPTVPRADARQFPSCVTHS